MGGKGTDGDRRGFLYLKLFKVSPKLSPSNNTVHPDFFAMAPYQFHLLHRTVYAGTFLHLSSRTELCVREDSILGVDEEGKIEFISKKKADGGNAGLTNEWIDEEVERQGWGRRSEDGNEEEESLTAGGKGGREGEKKRGWVLVRAGKGEWWFPGFVGKFFVSFFDFCVCEDLIC